MTYNNTLKDEQLFKLMKDNDSKAFESLFRRHYNPLCRKIIRITEDEEAAEDVVQQLFIKIWESRSMMEVPDSVAAYLTVSARNRALNHLKSAQRKRINEERLQNIRSEEDNSSQHQLEAKELNKLIQEAIQSLPEKRREIFVLSRFEGMSYREIAEQLGISIKTVEAQMGKALQTLREFIKEYQANPMLLLFFSIFRFL